MSAENNIKYRLTRYKLAVYSSLTAQQYNAQLQVMEALEIIINHLRACDDEIVELCARPMHISGQRNLSILDDYEYTGATDYLSDGFKDLS